MIWFPSQKRINFRQNLLKKFQSFNPTLSILLLILLFSGYGINSKANPRYEIKDNFNTGIDSSNWHTINNGTTNTNCGAVSGEALYFSGSGNRQIITIGMNASKGGKITFNLKIGTGGTPCESAEVGDEVELQYSVNQGSTWQLIKRFGVSDFPDFKLQEFDIPQGAKSDFTQFRWIQPDHSDSNYDSWAIDEVIIKTQPIVPNDAGIIAPNSPKSFCKGEQTIEATIANFGYDTLFDVTINWEFNGVLQTPINYNKPIDTLGSGNNTVNIALGTKELKVGEESNLKIWTTNPNGKQDTFNINDTLEYVVKLSLEGTFTIGGDNPDYPDFTSAVSALEAHGICGAVTFNVRNGTYNEQIILNEYAGGDSMRRVTFQSESGDSTQVILRYRAGYDKNFILKFNSADYITIKGMTVEATGSYGRVVELLKGANHICIENNILKGRKAYSTETNSSIVSIEESNYFKFKNNSVINGSIGINYYNSNYVIGTEIEGNQFINQYAKGIHLFRHSSPKINDNTIKTNSSHINYFGIVSEYSRLGGEVMSNQVFGEKVSLGIYLNNLNGTFAQQNVIANNFVRIGTKESTSSEIGLYLSNSKYQKIYHNSIHIASSNSNTSAIHIDSNSDIAIINNILANKGEGYAYSNSLDTGSVISDYNNLFTTGDYLISANNVKYKSLLDWQEDNKTKEVNSLSVNPFFKTDNSYQVAQSLLNGKGLKHIGIITDIEGEARDTAQPDIGAYEFDLPLIDAGIKVIDAPIVPFSEGKYLISANLQNHGSDTLTKVTINWEINNVLRPALNWTGALLPGDTFKVALDSFDFRIGDVYDMKVWTSNPNGAIDLININDTATVENLSASLGGIYTIGGINPDFTSFSEATDALNKGGVVEAVTFMVRNGTYKEQIILNEYIGVDSMRRVTFQSESGDSSQVILTYDAWYNKNFTLKFNSADYITIKGMTLEATDEAYGNVIEISRGSNHICIKGNILKGERTYSTVSGRTIVSIAESNSFKFKNNRVINGNIGIYYHYSNYASGTEIEGNQFINQYAKGIHLSQHSSSKINNNIIKTNSSYTNYYGILYQYSRLGGEVMRNQIFGEKVKYGIYLKNVDGTLAQQNIIANNFVRIGTKESTSTQYGLYLGNSKYQKVYHNTIHITSSNSNTSAIYSDSNSDIAIINNILVSTGEGYAYSNNLDTGSIISDYNNLFTTGDYLISANNVKYKSLLDWQKNDKTKEVNSLSVNPFFKTDTSYQVAQSLLNGKGLKHIGVITDIEGEARDTAQPDIGAYEFDLLLIDAGIKAIDAPIVPFSQGKYLISANLQNHGLDTLTKVTINWKINNVLRPPLNWTGALVPGDTFKVALDSFDFRIGEVYDMKAWTSNPNGTVDLININDTVTVENLAAGFGGIYTIGGNNPDFTSFSEATDALNKGGVIDAVTFMVRNGTYNEQIILNEYIGVDSMRRVTFQSESGDSSQVILTYEAWYNKNFTLKFNSADYITIKGMTVEATGSYGRVVELSKGSSHICIENNILKGRKTYSTGANSSIVSIEESNYFKFKNNRVINGSIGIYSNYASGTEIEGNQFINQYEKGIHLSRPNSPKINNNIIKTNSSYTYYYGITNQYSRQGGEIMRNQIFGKKVKYGIYLNNAHGTFAQQNIIANNFVRIGTEESTSTEYGLYLSNSNYQKVYHNSIHITSSNSNSSAVYNNSNSDIAFVNNILANTGEGYVYSSGSNSGSIISDYNNLFTTGDYLILANNIKYKSLLDWQKDNKTKEINSLSVNPFFKADTSYQVTQSLLNGKGEKHIGVIIDIEGEARDTAQPDIGAYEFDLSLNDAGISIIYAPTLTFTQGKYLISAGLQNHSSDTLTGVTINWEVNNILQPVLNWSGTLATGDTLKVALDSFDFKIGEVYDMKVWTNNPNGAVDLITINDTAKVERLVAGLAGVYTIGGVNPDFKDFTTAINTMKYGGVAGAVKFNVRNGVYDERLVIPEILGADSIQTITFQSEEGDSTGVILQKTITPNDSNYVVLLDGADWITFKELTIKNESQQYAHVIELRNGASNNQFCFNRIIGRDINNTDSDYRLVQIHSNDCHHNIFSFNHFKEGSEGLYFRSSFGSYLKGTVISYNYFENQYYRAIDLEYHDAPIINDNIIKSNDVYASYSAITLDGVINNAKITRNIIKDIPYGAGIMVKEGGSYNREGLIANNFISIGNGSAENCYGMLLSWANYQKVYHNTVRIHSKSTDSYAFRLNSRNVAVKNNIFYCEDKGLAFVQYSSGTINANYNNLWTGTNQLASYNNKTIYSLSQWQTASNGDTNSISIKPRFLEDNSYEVNTLALDNAGTPLQEVTRDIEYEIRSSKTPDIGAYEFDYIEYNLGVIGIISPKNACEFSRAEELKVLIRNYGDTPQTGFNIGLELKGRISITENVGNLVVPPNDTASYTFLSILNLSQYDSFELKSYTLLAYDENPNNDTLIQKIQDTIPPIAICHPSYEIYLNPSGTANLTVSNINNNSSDNCAIDTMYLSRTVLTCEDLGRDTSLTLYVKDKVGNIDSCTTIITVKDTVAPVLECKSEISLVLDNQGMATLSSEDVLINMTENIDCNNASTKLNLSKTSFSCSDIGSQNVAFEAIDVAGNSATCSVQVTVMDDIGACNCQDTALIKNEKPITEGRYVTSKNISSAGVISKNTAVSFVAKEYIILKPGFHAEKESTFSARIDDCSQSNSIVPLETALTKPQLKQNKLTEIADPIAVKVRPNPFLGNTTIQFNLTTSEAIDIMIHDLAGKQIAVLAKQTFYEKGVHQIRFDASGQAPGMYLLILKTKDQRVIKKMVLSR